jgi:hypothetical protein
VLLYIRLLWLSPLHDLTKISEMAEPESSATLNIGQEPEPELAPPDLEVRSIFDGKPTDIDYALSGPGR